MAPYKPATAQFSKPGYGFQPRKPVSFLDLEVYQKSLNLSVMVMKHMVFPAELGRCGKDKPLSAAAPIETDKPGREFCAESEELSGESGKEIVCRALLKNMLPCILGFRFRARNRKLRALLTKGRVSPRDIGQSVQSFCA